MEKYKNLGQLITDCMYYEPTPVGPQKCNLRNNLHDIEQARMREAHKHRD